MEIFIFILCYLVAVGTSMLMGYLIGKNSQRKATRKIGLKAVCTIITEAKNKEDLDERLKKVSEIASALINLKLIGILDVTEFVSEHILFKAKDFEHQAYNKKRAEEMMKDREAMMTKMGVCGTSGDIIHTKKKGVTRKVARDSKGHFVKKPTKSQSRRIAVMRKTK